MKISLLGTGILGFVLAEKVNELGFDLCVYNRTKSKAAPLEARGVKVVDSASEAIEYSDCILLMLSDAQSIDQVLFTDQVASFKGKTIIQMGTISPSQSIEIKNKVNSLAGQYLECPVLGSRREIKESTIIMMVGSSKDDFNQHKDFLLQLGSKLHYIGEVGEAAALKLAMNQLIAAHAMSFGLSVALIKKNNVPIEQFSKILEQSALYAPMYTKKLSNWLSNSYDNPNFPTKHLLKDVNLVIEDAKQHGLNVEVIESIQKVISQAIDRGFGEEDYSSVFKAINQ